jgi:hypothetical protein
MIEFKITTPGEHYLTYKVFESEEAMMLYYADRCIAFGERQTVFHEKMLYTSLFPSGNDYNVGEIISTMDYNEVFVSYVAMKAAISLNQLTKTYDSHNLVDDFRRQITGALFDSRIDLSPFKVEIEGKKYVIEEAVFNLLAKNGLIPPRNTPKCMG